MVNNNVVEDQCDGIDTTPNEDNEYLKDVIRAFDKLKNVTDFNRFALKLTIEEEHVNSKKTLHGGQTTALVDMVTAREAGVTIKDKAMASIEVAVRLLFYRPGPAAPTVASRTLSTDFSGSMIPPLVFTSGAKRSASTLSKRGVKDFRISDAYKIHLPTGEKYNHRTEIKITPVLRAIDKKTIIE